MTTKVIVTCPETSHWDVEISVQDQYYNASTKQMTDEFTEVNKVVLKPTESYETYIHASRIIVVSEKERV